MTGASWEGGDIIAGGSIGISRSWLKSSFNFSELKRGDEAATHNGSKLYYVAARFSFLADDITRVFTLSIAAKL
jgi:hypothetical protein